MAAPAPHAQLVREKDARNVEAARPAPGAGGGAGAAKAASADYNLRILWTLARYVEDRHGAAALAQMTADTGVAPADFESKSRWVSAETFETLLSRARALMPDDETFMRACSYRMNDAYGAIRYVLWAASPGAVYAQGIKTYHLVSTVGKPSIAAQDRTHFHMRIESDGRPISRLNCLVRQAQCMALPTIWGLPEAIVQEDACIAHGDASCELHFRWYLGRSWLRIVAAAILFGILGAVLARLGFIMPPMPVVFGVLGASIAYSLEGRRVERTNETTRQGVMDALRSLAMDEAEARRELIELGQRQKGWTRLVEEEMTSRAAALQSLVSGIHEERASKVLGFSHDLRNPLQIILASTQYLEEVGAVAADPEATEAVRDIAQSAQRMRRMLTELVQVAKSQRAFVAMDPQVVEMAGMTDALRRRIRALVYGRDVRATVFATREVPEQLKVDPVALDRIVDNLLTNAAKYTERGSIVVELDGTPDYLVLKVSDTGKGIEPGDVERIFQAGGSSPESRRGDSFGVGLSVVVQLLDQMGGRLEIMSRPGSGTTFWVYLPLAPAPPRASRPDTPSETAIESTGTALSRVVRIRKQPA